MATFKVVVKNGDNEYKLNPKTHQYEYKDVDYVHMCDNALEAIKYCLDWYDEEDKTFEHTVKLVFYPEKKGK